LTLLDFQQSTICDPSVKKTQHIRDLCDYDWHRTCRTVGGLCLVCSSL